MKEDRRTATRGPQLPVKIAQHQQRPDPCGVVEGAVEMLGEKAADRVGPEMGHRGILGVGEDLPHPLFERAAEPVVEGGAEPGFRAAVEFRREEFAECVAENHFPLAAPNLVFHRNPRRQVEDVVVQNRTADFQTPGHRRDIHLREDVAGQVGLDVGQTDLRDEIALFGAAHRADQPVENVVVGRFRRGGPV